MEQPEKIKSELSWLLAAGIVGADIGTSVFYGTGILFPIVGYLAPLFVLLACLAMWLFKRTYEEGLAMSPYNGGAYSMILRSVGKRTAVFAGALTFVSYLATAAVSSLSGGFYFSSLFAGGLSNSTVVWISFLPVIFFGILNIKGIKESAKLVTGIAITHFSLLIIITLWSIVYIIFYWSEIDFSKFGDLSYFPKPLGLATLAYGMSAAFLGITGFESAAQIVETLKPPTSDTVRTLYRAVILLVSFTAPAISLMCLTILTPDEVQGNLNYLLSGLAEKIGGTFLLTLIVLDATCTLFAATNTAFIGCIGLATTMAKHGNLPQFFLKRISHIVPSLEGYPFTVVSLMMIVMGTCAFVAGEVTIAAKVYEIAFLGVMVSFALGAIVMRNKGFRQSTPKKYLSSTYLRINGTQLSLPPLATAGILSCAIFFLITHVNSDVLFMLTFLMGITLMLMAYYRWGVLENRLETHTDLRLALGRFIHNVHEELPKDLPKYILCIGEHRVRRLISKTLNFILSKQKGGAFELILFYAENEGATSRNIFYELLQRVVSQQIAPIYASKDIILTVKILPSRVLEGLQTLKKSIEPVDIYFGIGRNPDHSHKTRTHISRELEMPITIIH